MTANTDYSIIFLSGSLPQCPKVWQNFVNSRDWFPLDADSDYSGMELLNEDLKEYGAVFHDVPYSRYLVEHDRIVAFSTEIGYSTFLLKYS